MMRLVGLRLLDETNWKGLKMPNLVVVTAKFTPNLAVWTDFIFYSR